MGLTSFCACLTIQVGVTVLAAVFLTLGAVILVANLLEWAADDTGGPSRLEIGQIDEDVSDQAKDNHTHEILRDKSEILGDNEGSTSWSAIFVIGFVILMFIIGLLMFCAAYMESRSVAMLALFVLLLTTTWWVILCILSFIGTESTKETVCYKTRCPETLWLASNLNYKKWGNYREWEYVEPQNEWTDMDNRTLRDLKVGTFRSENLTLEIQQTLGALMKLESRLKSCCEKECVSMKGDHNQSFCDTDFTSWFLTINKQLEDLTRSNNLTRKIFKKSIYEQENMRFYAFQNVSAVCPTNVHVKHIKSPSGLLENEKISPKYRNKRDVNDTAGKEKERNPEKWSEADDLQRKPPNREKTGSSLNFGLPLIFSIFLFLANFLFFLFSMLILWSWMKELSENTCGDDYVDEVYYYY